MRGGPYYDPPSDSTWILTSTFIIFTMQSGFGLLESGSVSAKNEVNIMVKNAADVIFGGMTYWMFGYGLSFGEGEYANAFCGWGNFFVHAEESQIGWVYSKFFFQSAFATTSTTIVSGAMAERTKLEAYIIFSSLSTFIFCFPAHWLWDKNGWLLKLGVIDIAGTCPVHIVGGVTGLVSTLMLKPRYNKYNKLTTPQMGSPTNALLGMFMLWWGWLGFNCGSTLGISGYKWTLAARSAVATICSSMGGGMVGLGMSFVLNGRKYLIDFLINGVLSSLVSITAFCALAQPWEGFLIGITGALISLSAIILLDKLRVDDPVGCVGVHGFGGVWGMLSVGLFARQDKLRDDLSLGNEYSGLFQSGHFYLLGVQTLAVVVTIVWAAVLSFLLFTIIDLTLGLWVSLDKEILGADVVEHNIGEISYDKRSSKIKPIEDSSGDEENHVTKGHTLQKTKMDATRKRRRKRALEAREMIDVINKEEIFRKKYYLSLWKHAISNSRKRTKSQANESSQTKEESLVLNRQKSRCNVKEIIDTQYKRKPRSSSDSLSHIVDKLTSYRIAIEATAVESKDNTTDNTADFTETYIDPSH